MLCVVFCDVCYSVLCVIVVPLPPGINPLAVINNIIYKCPEKVWGPPSFLFDSFPGSRRPCVKLTTDVLVVPWLRIIEAIPPFNNTDIYVSVRSCSNPVPNRAHISLFIFC